MVYDHDTLHNTYHTFCVFLAAGKALASKTRRRASANFGMAYSLLRTLVTAPMSIAYTDINIIII